MRCHGKCNKELIIGQRVTYIGQGRVLTSTQIDQRELRIYCMECTGVETVQAIEDREAEERLAKQGHKPGHDCFYCKSRWPGAVVV